MKNIASIITSIIIVISLTVISVQAKGDYDCGEYTIYIIDGFDGDCILTSYRGTKTNVEIPERINNDGLIYGTVREIGYRSFADCDFLVSVIIPKTVYLIDMNAFEYCTNLNKITIPPSVKEIRELAFRGCDKLTIYGYINTAAETYAKENNIPFESIGVYTEPITSPTTTVPNKTQITATNPTYKHTTKVSPVTKTKKAVIKKLTTTKKGTLKVTWKKVSGAKGYEIKLATNKKFTKNKKTLKIKKGSVVNKTIKKLKRGKKYFVKIRAYKKLKMDGYTVTATGPWSNIKRSKKIK